MLYCTWLDHRDTNYNRRTTDDCYDMLPAKVTHVRLYQSETISILPMLVRVKAYEPIMYTNDSSIHLYKDAYIR